MRLWAWLTGGAGERVLRTRCAACARIAAEARLLKGRDGVLLVYDGIVSGSGPNGAPVSRDRAKALVRAFRKPFLARNFEAADLYDHAGVCGQCRRPYC